MTTQPKPIREADLPIVTWRNCYRAFLRWWTPWNEDTRLMLMIVLTLVMFSLLIATLISRDIAEAVAFMGFVGQLVLLFIMWRATLSILFLVTSFDEAGRKSRKQAWGQLGQEPLFQDLRKVVALRKERRASAEWLISQGMSRQDARRAIRSRYP